MLQFQTEKVDIVRLSKLLVLYNIEAAISDKAITLTGDVSDDLLEKFCDCVSINAVQNFVGEVTEAEGESPEEKQDGKRTKKHSTSIPVQTEEYDLLYPTVKRGEVYLCDFGEPYGSEIGYIRPAIIVQTDVINSTSSCTIVVPCASNRNALWDMHQTINFRNAERFEHINKSINLHSSTMKAEYIRVVSKKRLREFCGVLTPEMMKLIQKKIDFALDLDREVKAEVQTVVETKPDASKTTESRDLNMTQVELLSFVDISKLFQISKSNSTDEARVAKILELFGFDSNKNGVQYLAKAIIASPKDGYFNLDSLVETISKNEDVEKEEIKRLIIARVKEHFKFKKSPTIEFIRLVNGFLVKETEE